MAGKILSSLLTWPTTLSSNLTTTPQIHIDLWQKKGIWIVKTHWLELILHVLDFHFQTAQHGLKSKSLSLFNLKHGHRLLFNNQTDCDRVIKHLMLFASTEHFKFKSCGIYVAAAANAQCHQCWWFPTQYCTCTYAQCTCLGPAITWVYVLFFVNRNLRLL